MTTQTSGYFLDFRVFLGLPDISRTSGYFSDFRVFLGLPGISRTSGTFKLNIRILFWPQSHSADFVKSLISLQVLKRLWSLLVLLQSGQSSHQHLLSGYPHFSTGALKKEVGSVFGTRSYTDFLDRFSDFGREQENTEVPLNRQ